MKPGKAFEILVKNILICVGFSEVKSDGLYVFDGAAGQMLQGLGEAHNADVLLEPPVQTPFFYRSRILVECKDYRTKINLNTVRSALGLKEDINNFNIVDIEKLKARRAPRRRRILHPYERFSYQVAIAALNGYTNPAQEFAATYRIPLLGFNMLPFWSEFCKILECINDFNERYGADGRYAYADVPKEQIEEQIEKQIEEKIIELVHKIGRRMALAITSSGQIIFLYHEQGKEIEFADGYVLRRESLEGLWRLCSGYESYLFQLPDGIMKQWLENAIDELDMKKEDINFEATALSNMVVYYTESGRPVIRMISINKDQLEEAKSALKQGSYDGHDGYDGYNGKMW